MVYQATVRIRISRFLTTLGLGLLIGWSAIVRAEALPKQPMLPLALAHKAALAAIQQCQADGYRVSAAIVGRAGVVKALLRSDGAGAHTVDSSRRKAYTAASLREPTQHLAELIAKHPQIQGLRDMSDSILILGGGFPIQMNGKIVGGIGVSGAPGADLDEACARAGLKVLGADLYKDSE